jgi:hypothetical protein
MVIFIVLVQPAARRPPPYRSGRSSFPLKFAGPQAEIALRDAVRRTRRRMGLFFERRASGSDRTGRSYQDFRSLVSPGPEEHP